MASDYKSTVFLPKTDFPMRAGLPQREPEFLARWAQMDLYKTLRADSKGREKFILHDGPPYANGNLHIGHALNKILKDVINRSQQMLGKDANYVPGWDCHGLPIEWQIEQNYRKAGKNKDDVPVVQFRQECRDFAAGWIDVQREEFKRLGVVGDWDHPYSTMAFPAEAQIAREICKFLMNGGLYRGSKPVMWSTVEKTALAEAEVEYHDKTSPTVFVRFPLLRTASTSLPDLSGTSVLIWTTTPWTLPGNRAVAFGNELQYQWVEVTQAVDGSLAKVGELLLVAADCLPEMMEKHGFLAKQKAIFHGRHLESAVCAHPFRGQGYDFDVPLFHGDFVTAEDGSGFVHIAPGHGADDFELGSRHGIAVPETVGPTGHYFDHVPLFAGKRIMKPDGKEGDANAAVIEALKGCGALFAEAKLVHSYPHSWRSKAPVIFRNTPQWFISMMKNDLREKALTAIDNVRWVPSQGRNRIYSMIENRPEWVISRQRAWGVPITVFVSKKTGEPLRDDKVNQRIFEAFEKEGADAWWKDDGQRFLGNDHAIADYEKIDDIVDVWFDSGSTHAFVLEQRDDLQWPASLYLEGSDQHRGWFHSSLLESCGTRGRAPYDAVLTHGFVMDGEGRKMSKSLGNVVSPQDIIKQHGADILRLWVVSSDYSEDLRIGDQIVQRQVDAYRKLRNTLRYIIASLDGFEDAEKIDVAQMPELERWVLHQLHGLDAIVRQAATDFDFHRMFVALYNFCTNDLSAFYFDVRKDALYCDRPDSIRRRATRTVLDILFRNLTAWLAPILCFTAEEAWLSRFPGEGSSVHRALFPVIPASWQDEALAKKWELVRQVRSVVTGALEVERREKRIGSSLEASPIVYADAKYQFACDGIDMAEICITSGFDFGEDDYPDGMFSLEEVAGVWVLPSSAGGGKCGRCWRVLDEVPADGAEKLQSLKERWNSSSQDEQAVDDLVFHYRLDFNEQYVKLGAKDMEPTPSLVELLFRGVEVCGRCADAVAHLHPAGAA